MQVEIWSDVMCPFCYIGKRKFEEALKQFPSRNEVLVSWKSFQLDAYLTTDPKRSLDEHLAEKKGWSLEYTRQMQQHVERMAEDVGLKFNLDKVVVANSFDAHRVLQLAKSLGRDNELEESLFKAYFTDGKNTADAETLVTLGIEAGLDEGAIRNVLNSDAYAIEVKRDIEESRRLGVRGVPFFAFNREYAVSGAQSSEVFLQVLEKAFAGKA